MRSHDATHQSRQTGVGDIDGSASIVTAIRPRRRIVERLRAVGLHVEIISEKVFPKLPNPLGAPPRRALRRADCHQGGAVTKRKKKTFSPLGKFAQIPVVTAKQVLGVLSATEFRVWFALCLQNQHWSNGTGKLCRSVIREFHLGSQRVVTGATKTLIEQNYIVRTRAARQRVCALYGVIHLPLNTDALAKAGLTDNEIRTVQARFASIVCDTNRGSASSATNGEALTNKTDIRGSAKPLEQPLVLPQGKRIGPFSTSLALPMGNTSKKYPDPTPMIDGEPAIMLAESQRNRGFWYVVDLRDQAYNSRPILGAAVGLLVGQIAGWARAEWHMSDQRDWFTEAA